MLAQLIQALYNIVDSLFVGRYAESGLTALSIVYPIQLLMVALAIGTGVGINTAMAARFGVGKRGGCPGICRDRHTAGRCSVGPLCRRCLAHPAGVCQAVLDLAGGSGGGGDLRPHRLHVQLRRVF